jgi:myo-inositol-1(or 4)-monophosphatase
MTYTEFLSDNLKAASALARQQFGKVAASSVKTGDNNQVLTETDLAVGRLLVAAVEQAFPDHNVIDEEAGVIDKKSQFTWVIDPIDGTSNFAEGLPHYGIMIGLLEDGVPIAGGVALPAFDEIYVAEKGQGSTCNGLPIRISDKTNLLDTLVTYGIDGHQENPEQTRQETALLANIVLAIRNLRSSNSAFDIMMTARGRYGAFLNQTSKIWDNVAPQIIMEEAGGVWTDFLGKPMDYSDPLAKATDNFTVCAGAPTLHGQLQRIIHA